MSKSPSPAPLTSSPLWLPSASLWWRDVLRFLRQRNRIISALATPLVFWLLLGAGFSESFRPPGESESSSYLEYFFPGTIVLIMLFTAIFSTISVIEDRREGFLQGLLVSPAHPTSIVLGKLLGGTTLAVGQGLLFCLLAPVAGLPLGPANIAPILLSFTLCGLAMTGLGFLFAWPLDSTAGFHALMNIFLMPLWMMSGALFPLTSAAGWAYWVTVINPVTYAVAAVRHALQPNPWAPLDGLLPLTWCLTITAAFALALFLAGLALVQRRKGPLV
jgi:ABC-2 type transport system permease protein